MLLLINSYRIISLSLFFFLGLWKFFIVFYFGFQTANAAEKTSKDCFSTNQHDFNMVLPLNHFVSHLLRKWLFQKHLRFWTINIKELQGKNKHTYNCKNKKHPGTMTLYSPCLTEKASPKDLLSYTAKFSFLQAYINDTNSLWIIKRKSKTNVLFKISYLNKLKLVYAALEFGPYYSLCQPK